MRRITKRSAAVLTASVLGVGALGGVALASGWLVTGTGTAQAETSQVKAMSADAVLNGKAYPGLQTTAKAYVDNDNEFPVVIDKVVVSTEGGKPKIEATKNGRTNTACLTKLAGIGEAPFTVGPVVKSLTVPAGKHDTELTGIKVAVSKKLPLECAGTSFTLFFTFSGTSTVATES